MESIIKELADAGYFRARMSTLSEFDKVIGGMAWAMQYFSCGTNIDIFYTDSLDLGQKIALTERLVAVLIAMSCPHSIEPHQIVGLDYANLLPVIRWLIKRSEETRLEHEAFNRLLALRHYRRVTNAPPDRSDWCHLVPLDQLRHLTPTKSPGEDSAATTACGRESRKTPPPISRLVARINEEFRDNKRISFVQLPSDIRPAQVQSARDGSPKSSADENQEESDDDAQSESNETVVEVDATGGERQQVEDTEATRELHHELDQELQATNQEILNLRMELDSIPSDLEIVQYQRRYIELHQQLISKNRDVKKLYDLYNSLSSTKHYLMREINLLDSISSNFDLTNDSPSNRELFSRQFNEILKKVELIRDDMNAKLEIVRRKHQALAEELAATGNV